MSSTPGGIKSIGPPMNQQLKTESSRVPLDDQVRNRPAPVSTVVAIDNSEKDQNYIKQFLKEISTIEQINLRSDKFIEEKAIQTYMLSNQN